MAQRTKHPSVIAGELGFGFAVIAKRDSIALFEGLRGAEQADAREQRLLGKICGALRIAALALTRPA